MRYQNLADIIRRDNELQDEVMVLVAKLNGNPGPIGGPDGAALKELLQAHLFARYLLRRLNTQSNGISSNPSREPVFRVGDFHFADE